MRSDQNHNPVNPQSIRLFLGIFPDKCIQDQLAHHVEKLATICGGKKVSLSQLHLTLVFLGDVPISRIKFLQQAISKVTAKKFAFELDEIRYWKKNEIVYIQARSFPAELYYLVDSLRNALTKSEFLIDKRAYKPHITLIRRARCLSQVDLNTSITWGVDKWFLIHSKQENNRIEYISLQHWNLI